MARRKVNERAHARTLRAAGWTLPAIEAELRVSRSSVSLWCRDIPVPHGTWTRRLRSPTAGQRKNPLQAAKEAQIEALRVDGLNRIGALSEREHLVAGLMLYSGEGAKGGSVKIANTDPRLVRFFCTWLRRHFQIDESRLRLTVHLHEGLDLGAAMVFWSTATGIPESQTCKPYRAAADPSRRTTKHLHGCCYVTYSDVRLLRTILALIDALIAAG